MSFLVDTNVVSELRKGERCDPRVRSWLANVDENAIYLSVLTIGEIRRGIESIRVRDAAAAAALEVWLRRLVADAGDRIIAVDEEVAEVWGTLNVPDPLPVVDGLLAATAKVHGLTIVTRNTKDFARTGMHCLNPFL